MRIVGPDSSHALGERLRFAIEAEPALPPGPLYVNWQSDNPALLVSAANGEFVVLGASARFTELGITATFGEVPVRRTILLGQSADSLRLACGTIAVPAACDATPMTVGATLDVRPRLVDAFGNVVRSPSGSTCTTPAVRTAVTARASASDGAAAGVIRLRATAAGTSWVVVRVDRGTDSVRVVVSP